MSKNSISGKRHDSILEKLQHHDMVSVNQLSQELSVSRVTIRRDLDYLGAKGLLERYHGGAYALDRHDGREHYLQYVSEKPLKNETIGRLTAEFIHDGDTVFLNNGALILDVITEIRGKKVKIVTNNTAVFSVDVDHNIEIFLIGGEYNKKNRAITGDMAQRNLSHINSSCTILEADGINPEMGLTSSDSWLASVNRAMIENSQGPVIILADKKTLGTVSNFVTAPSDRIDIIVTDSDVTPGIVGDFSSRGIKVYSQTNRLCEYSVKIV